MSLNATENAQLLAEILSNGLISQHEYTMIGFKLRDQSGLSDREWREYELFRKFLELTTEATISVTPTTPTLSNDVTSLKEESRTYIFPGDETMDFENVRELIVGNSGTHRLRTADGKIHIVAKSWLAITIVDETGNWTV